MVKILSISIRQKRKSWYARLKKSDGSRPEISLKTKEEKRARYIKSVVETLIELNYDCGDDGLASFDSMAYKIFYGKDKPTFESQVHEETFSDSTLDTKKPTVVMLRLAEKVEQLLLENNTLRRDKEDIQQKYNALISTREGRELRALQNARTREEAIDAFISSKNAGAKDNRRSRSALNKLFKVISGENISDIDALEIQKYLEKFADETGLTGDKWKERYNTRLGEFTRFSTYCHNMFEVADFGKKLKIKSTETKTNKVVSLNMAELRTLISKLDDYWVLPVALMGLFGISSGEARQLYYNDVTETEIHIYGDDKKGVKRGTRVRTLKLSDELKELIARYKETHAETDYLFPPNIKGVKNKNVWTEDQWLKEVRKVLPTS